MKITEQADTQALIGKIVRLKSGSPDLTVVGITPEGSLVVEWLSQTELSPATVIVVGNLS